MKTSIFILSFIILFSLIQGCGKYYKSVSAFSGNSENAIREIILDNTYKYYIRQLFMEKANGLKSQKNFVNKTALDSLLEVEYLFISEIHKNIIYITTVPDKYQKYYRDTSRYRGEKYVNVYDFKKICFGKLVQKDSIEFISKDFRNRFVWNIRESKKAGDNFITILTVEKDYKDEFVDLIPVSKALQDDIMFKESRSFSLIFFRNDRDSVWANSLDNKFYINKQKKKYELGFRFDRIVSGGSDIIYFKDERVEYSPEPLLKTP